MKWIDQLASKFKSDSTLQAIVKVVLILLIVYLFKLTDSVWKGLLGKIVTILLPFVLGFIIAYVIRPIVVRAEKKNIKRKFTIPITYILLLILVTWLLFTIIPLVYSRLNGFINSIIAGVNWLYSLYTEASENVPNPFVQTMVNQANTLLNDTKSWIPNLSSLLPQIINSVISFVTNCLFTLIISIYISFDWEHITSMIDLVSAKIYRSLPKYLHACDDEIGDYLHALVMLMCIKFFEYSLLYFLIGHKDWMIIGLLTSIGLIIPYFGATIANLIGILTSLTLPLHSTIILIIAIIVLANVDAYIIAPLVHSRNSKVAPLWTLFSVFAGGILFGPLGIMLSIPAYMSIRVIINLYRNEKEN